MPVMEPPVQSRGEAVDDDAGLVGVIEDFHGRLRTLDGDVVDVRELVGHEGVGVCRRLFARELRARRDGLADVAVVMDELDLRTVGLADLAALDRDRIGHDDAHVVAAYRAHEGQANALVAARRLDDGGPAGCDLSASLGLEDHVVRRARLDRTADVECLELHENLRAVLVGNVPQTDEGRVAHRLEHVVVNHDFLLHHAAAQAACHANISENYTRTPSGCREAPLPFPNRFSWR